VTLELERTTPSSTSNPHEPLVLVETESLTEFLVVVEGSRQALAVAVIRVEETGTYCYPHGPVHPRLGPFGSAIEALEAAREVQRTERCYDSCCHGLS
jgi:hypothetical protein